MEVIVPDMIGHISGYSVVIITAEQKHNSNIFWYKPIMGAGGIMKAVGMRMDTGTKKNHINLHNQWVPEKKRVQSVRIIGKEFILMGDKLLGLPGGR